MLHNKEIQEVLKQQNVWSWIVDIFEKKTKTVKFNVEYDETLLDEQINQLKILKENQIRGENAKPVFNGEQFVIQKGNEWYGD
ncbi:MAG: peptidoglycan binding domain-containing protein [Clostridia bacterium]